MESLDRIAETLAAHGVRFVVIGNYGAQLHGVTVETEDADMAYQRTEENHRRLAAALDEMDTHLRWGDSVARLPANFPELLAQSNVWSLRTIYGDLDMLFAPRGGGYDHLLTNAEWIAVRGYPVLVASMDDIIHSKELANRDKDHKTLPTLRRFRDEQQRRREGHGLSLDL